MADEQTRREPGEGFREGVRAVFGVMGALKDAIEDTFQDLLDQGELSPERAREAARSTVKKAQETVDDMRGRLDFVSRREFDALREEVAELRRLVEEHSGAGHLHARPAPTQPPASPPGSPHFTPPYTPPPGPVTDQSTAGGGAQDAEKQPEGKEDRPRFTIDDA